MSTTSENNKRIAKNTLLLYLRMLLTMGVSLYTSRVILQVLGVEDFGIYNVVGGVVAMFAFLNGALSASTSRFITIELGKKDYVKLQKVFNAAVMNHWLIVVIIFLLAETIGLWFVQNKLVFPPERYSAALWVYQVSILTCLISLIQTPYNAVIIANERMNVYAWVSIVDSVLRLMVLYLLILFDFDKLKLYAVLLMIITLLIFIFYFLYVKRTFSYCAFKVQKDKQLFKSLFAYSGWDLIGNFSVVVQGQGLNMLLNMFFGAAVNAARGIAFQIQGAILQFSGNFMTAVRPQIIKYYAMGEKEKMIDLVFSASKYSFFLLWVLSLPVFLEINYILNLWLDIVPDYTASFARIILLTMLIGAFRTPFIAAMHATGKIKLPNIVCGSILISALPISYVCLRQGFSPTSVFFVTLAISFIVWGVELVLIKKLVGYSIRLFVRSILSRCFLVSILSMILPIATFHTMPIGILRLISVALSSLVSMMILVYYIGINSDTRTAIKHKAKSVIDKYIKE